jgi:hypothetical protein|tara:strand:+ start:318 stop:458 length:141 start_codon:yes stop_codon:yes gene_type:complete
VSPIFKNINQTFMPQAMAVVAGKGSVYTLAEVARRLKAENNPSVKT